MDYSNINVQELADRYEKKPDEVLPEIANILKELNSRGSDNPTRKQSQLATNLVSECTNRNPKHFRDNFSKHVAVEEEEWIVEPF